MLKVQPSLHKFLFDSCILEMLFVSESILVGSEGLRSESLGSNGYSSSHDFHCVLVSSLNEDSKPCPKSEFVVFDPMLSSPSHKLARKRKKGYELNRHF